MIDGGGIDCSTPEGGFGTYFVCWLAIQDDKVLNGFLHALPVDSVSESTQGLWNTCMTTSWGHMELLQENRF